MKKNPPSVCAQSARLFSLTHWLLAALALSAGGCAFPVAYHRNVPSSKWDHSQSVKPKDAPDAEKDQKYDLAFIEFGEEGSYFDLSQVEFATDLIHHRKNPFVFVYLHGWHHNSDPNDGDVKHFKDALQMLSAVVKDRDVIGVYLGWQGETLKQPPGLNSILTYYTRKSAAERLANNFDCLDAIGNVVSEAHNRGGRSLIVGHSFGGLVLERAVKSTLTNPSVNGENINLRDSLIVMLNPATESILTRQIDEEFAGRIVYDAKKGAYTSRTTKKAIARGNEPFVVSITSENDQATGLLFPISSWLWRRTHPFRGYQRVELPPSWEDPSKPQPAGDVQKSKKVWEGEFFEHTPGNEPKLVNFHAEQKGTSPKGKVTAFEENLKTHYDPKKLEFVTSAKGQRQDEGASVNTWNSADQKTLWKIAYKENALTPYWIIRVPKVIINNHGGIWNDNSIAMIAAIYRMKFPLEGSHERGPVSVPTSVRSLSKPDAIIQRQLQ